jgi:predicted metal-binding membrane protein
MEADTADELRERGRLFLYSFVWTAACGLLLIVLCLSEPGGVLSPTAALAGALVLIAVLAALGIATWRLSDELARTLSHEAGNMAFYLILVLGGGWAMLAHLGFVAGPAPLDWLTLLTALMFVASVIAAGRRKLLTR